MNKHEATKPNLAAADNFLGDIAQVSTLSKRIWGYRKNGFRQPVALFLLKTSNIATDSRRTLTGSEAHLSIKVPRISFKSEGIQGNSRSQQKNLSTRSGNETTDDMSVHLCRQNNQKNLQEPNRKQYPKPQLLTTSNFKLVRDKHGLQVLTTFIDLQLKKNEKRALQSS